MNILVTGGAGYIGSHVVDELKANGYTPIVFDNLSTGHRESVPNDVEFVFGDIHDVDLVATACLKYDIKAIIHFAASSLVGESMQDPAKYYFNNVVGTFNLLEGMRKAGVNKIVFSSTAAVYGEPEKWPIEENFKTQPTNTYGKTKLIIENMMSDYTRAYGFNYVALRYFNAAGASMTRDIGEAHNPESHLIPLILKTAQGIRDRIAIFGTDYPTDDGTCIRDYIHVCDLASAHVLSLQYLLDGGESDVFNLGTQQGFSVKQIINMAKDITKLDFKVEEESRRPGDPAVLIASSEKISQKLGWETNFSDVRNVVASAWKWHKNHPNGY